MLSRLLLLCAALLPAAAHCLTVEQATNPRGIVHVAIAPGGKHMAAISTNGFYNHLAVIDTDTLSIRVLNNNILFGRKAPLQVFWAANDVMVVNYDAEAETVDMDGKAIHGLGGRILGPLDPKRPAGLLLGYTDGDRDQMALVEALTGAKRKLRYPMSGKPLKWVVDREGELRAMTMMSSESGEDRLRISQWYRRDGKSEWQKLADFGAAEDRWQPVLIDPETDGLVVRSRAGRDTYALFAYDVDKRQLGEVVADGGSADLIVTESDGDGTLNPVRADGMAPRRVWLDPAWTKAQAAVDAALPGKINNLSGNPAHRLVVYSYSDTDPGSWYVMDMKALTLRGFASRLESLDGVEMRPMRMVSYPAEDGLAIPALLTTPAVAAQPGPAIILVHGGLNTHDYWRWNADVQMLAAQGYTVLQPQFRGSAGFGKNFEQAGDGQFGLARQDDIAAGVAYLVQQGLADPKRVCIHGSGYGGYAALWGLIKTPGLYRCGISVGGVSDLEHLFNDGSHSKLALQLMAARIGDIRLKQADFAQVSPVRNAGRIQAPVLLMHGAENTSVPISHSEQMARALERNAIPHQYVRFEYGGAGFFFANDRIRYYRTLLDFLDRHIGAGAGQK